jgi:hypothetical protein
MRAHSDLELLDLRPVLRAERRQDRGDDLTYFPLGTHWTERGAFAGYSALVQRLAETRPGLAPLAPEAFDVEREDGLGDNWGGRLYMRDLLTQAYLAWTLREPRAREIEVSAGDRHAVYERPEAPQLPTGLLLHDSFGLPLRPWLAEHFSRLECEWTTRFDAEAVERTRPDFVIQLYSEFTLVPFMPQPTELEDEGATRARFEASREVLWRLDDLQDVGALESGSTLALEDGVLRLERRGPEETLLLPPLDLPDDRTLLLLVEVEAPQDDSLYLLYQTRRERSYDRTRSTQATLREGRSSICLVLPPRGYAGRLDLHVGIRPGTFKVRRIELRAEAP